MDSRERVLAAVRSANHAAMDGEVPRAYLTTLAPEQLEGSDQVALFAERVDDYRAEVHRVDQQSLPRTIGQVLGQHKVKSLVVPADIDARWLSTTHARVVRDSPDLSAAELDQVDAVVTGSAVAVALTGTIVLDSGAEQGRRVISLVPDLHVCVVKESAIVGSVPEAVRALDPTRPLTWISGPSATSDIELNRVEGVHGPRTLIVVIVAD